VKASAQSSQFLVTKPENSKKAAKAHAKNGEEKRALRSSAKTACAYAAAGAKCRKRNWKLSIWKASQKAYQREEMAKISAKKPINESSREGVWRNQWRRISKKKNWSSINLIISEEGVSCWNSRHMKKKKEETRNLVCHEKCPLKKTSRRRRKHQKMKIGEGLGRNEEELPDGRLSGSCIFSQILVTVHACLYCDW